MSSNPRKELAWKENLLAGLAKVNARYSFGLFLLILALGLVVRLINLNDPFLGHFMWNEVYYTTIARNFQHFGLLTQYNFEATGGYPLRLIVGPPPVTPWLVYFSSLLFGTAEWAARLPMLLLGMVTLAALYMIARELYDNHTGLLAVFLASIMPGAIFISRQVALDVPMVAFGLLSILTMMVAARKYSLAWMFISAVLIGLSILAKYTGILFLPALAWLWIKMFRRGDLALKKASWFLALPYLLIAAVPSVVWVCYGTIRSAGDVSSSHIPVYLDRFSEFNPENMVIAFQSTWARLNDQVGHMPWYLLALAGVLAIGSGRLIWFIHQNRDVCLLIFPFFIPMLYPVSWTNNDAYTYPALYGIAILLAVIIKSLLYTVQRWVNFSNWQMFSSAAFLVVAVIGSNLWDYQAVFQVWYRPLYSTSWSEQLPVYLVTPNDPLASARQVRALNTKNLPVLADSPATLYYALDKYWETKATWWWWGVSGSIEHMIESIQSREYHYVVFTYKPPMEILDSLAGNGYRRIGPALWEKGENH